MSAEIKNIQIGQKWRTRDGRVATITEPDTGPWHFWKSDLGFLHGRCGGLYSYGEPAGGDLMKLIDEEPAEDLAAPAVVGTGVVIEIQEAGTYLIHDVHVHPTITKVGD